MKLKEKVEAQSEMIESLNKLIESYGRTNKEIFDGWDNTLKHWRKSITMCFVLTLAACIDGILIGLLIRGAWP